MGSGEGCGRVVGDDDDDLAAMLHDVKKASDAYAGKFCTKKGASEQDVSEEHCQTVWAPSSSGFPWHRHQSLTQLNRAQMLSHG